MVGQGGGMTYFRLDGGGDTVVLHLADFGAPRLVYWGEALAQGADLEALAALTPPIPQGGGLDDGEQLSWLPERGWGFNAHPGIEAHRNGAEVITQGRIAEAHWVRGAGYAQLNLNISMDS